MEMDGNGEGTNMQGRNEQGQIICGTCCVVVRARCCYCGVELEGMFYDKQCCWECYFSPDEEAKP